MGCKGNSWLVLGIMLGALVWEVGGNQTRDSLDSFLHEYAVRNVPMVRTGTLYSVAPPVNLSGVAVSIVRLRTHRLWSNGANFSSIEIPPKTVLPRPFTRRIQIVYHNLGNWSASYYSVPDHTLVSPVIAFLVYDSYKSSNQSRLVELNARAAASNSNQIHVHFPAQENHQRAPLKCVRFDKNGTLELSNVSVGTSCVATGSGHFSLAIPEANKGRKRRAFQGWMVGVIAGGVVGLGIILGLVGYMLSEFYKVKRMERQAERSEGLNTIWIGDSRMPTASGIRTQPILENSYVP